MSVATRTGDGGTTGLLYNRRVPKSHPRIEAVGTIDELNAAIGMARALNGAGFVGENLLPIQKDLVNFMGEVATLPEDLERYRRDFESITPACTEKLDRLVAEIEGQGISYRGWATPGANAQAAALDVARTTCRRAERRIHALRETGDIQNTEMLIYLNRLSDVLWLMARWVETNLERAGAESSGSDQQKLS
jgi:cob(I)alamin adenosyltransferase